jgi:uncharacterized damage-inducible protein DinB
VSLPFPEPTAEVGPLAEVLLGYLDYFRSVLVAKLSSVHEGTLRSSTLPSGWTPLELLKHLTFVELRWLEWGFEGRRVPDPWGDRRDDRWHVGPEESLEAQVAALDQRAQETRSIVCRHDLAERGLPGERWDGAEPATLERVLLHLLQEYARHVGHLDVVVELSGGASGE